MPVRTKSPYLTTICILAAAVLMSATVWAQSNLLQQGLGLLSSGGSKTGSLSQGEMGDGLKEALRVGTGNVVAKLAQTDGFVHGQGHPHQPGRENHGAAEKGVQQIAKTT